MPRVNTERSMNEPFEDEEEAKSLSKLEREVVERSCT